MNEQRLEEILKGLSKARLGVLGDFCLDRYFDIDPDIEETSLETFRPAHQVFRVRCSPGGAGNVAANVAALGVAKLYAIGPIGNDGEGFSLCRELEALGVCLDHLIKHLDYLTPTYNKPLVIYKDKEPFELDRIDIRTRTVLAADLEEGLVAALESTFPSLSGLLIADQFEDRNHHAVTDRVRQRAVELAGADSSKFVFADSRARTSEFRNVILKPNRGELAVALGLPEAPSTLPDTAAMGRKLADQSGRPVFVTLSEEGVLLCEPGDPITHHIPGYKVTPPIDVCGAGDTTISGMASALCAGANLQEAGLIGCLAASVTVQKIGITGTATPDEIRKRYSEYKSNNLEVTPVSTA